MSQTSEIKARDDKLRYIQNTFAESVQLLEREREKTLSCCFSFVLASQLRGYVEHIKCYFSLIHSAHSSDTKSMFDLPTFD